MLTTGHRVYICTNVLQGDAKGGLEFPSVTFCNFNRIKKSKAEAYNFTQDLRKFFFSQFFVLYSGMSNAVNKSTPEQFKKWREENGKTPSMMR